jgi:hypothetical protein
MVSCTDIVTIGRVRWIEGSKHTGKDNFGWFRFDGEHRSGPVFPRATRSRLRGERAHARNAAGLTSRTALAPVSLPEACETFLAVTRYSKSRTFYAQHLFSCAPSLRQIGLRQQLGMAADSTTA